MNPHDAPIFAAAYTGGVALMTIALGYGNQKWPETFQQVPLPFALIWPFVIAGVTIHYGFKTLGEVGAWLAKGGRDDL